MNIHIATVATPDIQDYAKYSIALNADYALRHGYGFHVFNAPNKERYPSWGKVECAKLFLPFCDWLFVIDADAVFVNVEKKLQDFTAIDGELLVCENGPNGGRLLNSGAMFFKSTLGVNRFLGEWWDSREKYAVKYFQEQQALNDLYESGASIKIVPLPYDTFNSHFLDYRQPLWRERFVLHVMQHSTDQRAKIFRHIYEMRDGTRAIGPLVD